MLSHCHQKNVECLRAQGEFPFIFMTIVMYKPLQLSYTTERLLTKEAGQAIRKHATIYLFLPQLSLLRGNSMKSEESTGYYYSPEASCL